MPLVLFHLDSTSHLYFLLFVLCPTPALRSPLLLTGRASTRSNGQTKKLTVGILQLSVEVTHYIVPSKEAAAYLQAKVRLTTCTGTQRC